MPFYLKKNTVSLGLAKEYERIVKKGHLAVKRGLEVMRSNVVDNTPVDTGLLKASIGGSGRDTVFEVSSQGFGVISGQVGTKLPYALGVELGKGWGSPKQLANAGFFSTAIEESSNDVISVMQSTMKL